MGRPVGVTILGALLVVAGLGFAVTGLMFLFAGSRGATEIIETSGLMAAVSAALGAAAGVIFLFFGGLHIVLAIGIFQMRNVARILTIFLFVLIGTGSCLGLIATLLSYSHVGLAWNAALLVVAALALWYLLRPDVKEAFGA